MIREFGRKWKMVFFHSCYFQSNTSQIKSFLSIFFSLSLCRSKKKMRDEKARRERKTKKNWKVNHFMLVVNSFLVIIPFIFSYLFSLSLFLLSCLRASQKKCRMRIKWMENIKKNLKWLNWCPTVFFFFFLFHFILGISYLLLLFSTLLLMLLYFVSFLSLSIGIEWWGKLQIEWVRIVSYFRTHQTK